MTIGSATLAIAHHRAIFVNGKRLSGDAEIACECRARGQIYTTGEQICLNGRVATCAMDQNVTTWKLSGKHCPEANLHHAKLQQANLSPRLMDPVFKAKPPPAN